LKFSYGKGKYAEGEKRFEGQIILGEHKLYLKNADGDIAQTYIPLEKIEGIRKTRTGLMVNTRPSLYFRFTALISGEKRHISNLARDIIKRRNLKRKFFKNEWVEGAR